MGKSHFQAVPFSLSGFFPVILSLLTCCSSIKWRYEKINVILPENSPVSREEILAVFQPLQSPGDPGTLLDVTVYSYTPGYESIRFTGENRLTQNYHPGNLKLLLKLKKNSSTEEIRFINVDGRDKAEMLTRLESLVRSMPR